MPIYIEEQDKQLFEKNGFTYDDVKNTIDHYRGQGLSDDDIQGKINKRLEEWKTPKQSFIDFLGENLNNSNPYEDVALKTNTAFQAVQQPVKQISQPVEQFQNSNIPTYNELLKSVNNPNLEPSQNTIENRLNTPILSTRNTQQVTDEQKPMVLKGGVREDVDLGNIGEIKPLSRFESFKNQLSAKKRLADEEYQKLKSEYDKMLAEKDTNSWTNKVDLRPATYINNLIGGIGGVANDVLPFAMSGYFDNIKGLTKDSLEAFKRGWQNTDAMRGNSRLLDNTELLQNLAIYFSTLGKSGALFNTLPKETQTLAISKFLQQNPAFARSILAGYTSGTLNSLAEKGLSPDLPID